MNINKLISIVVPIFNGEKYVGKMIDSLLNQTYKNYEIIIVDDFSADNSLTIIQNKVGSDSRFKLIHACYKLGTAVKGQEYALPYCSGEYYFFLSQDDFIDRDFLEKCIKKSVETNADVVLPNCVHYYGRRKKYHGRYPLNKDYNAVLTARDAFELSLTWQIHGFAFRKMSLVRQVGMKGEFYNSCEYYGRLSLLKANMVVFVDTNFFYRQNNQNAITKGLKYFHVDILKTDVMLLNKYIEEGYDRKKCLRRYRSLIGGWLAWWIKAIQNKILFVSDGYVIKMLLNVQIDLIKLVPELLGVSGRGEEPL